MSNKFTSVRMTIEGEHYEILVYPDPALNYKMGRNVDPTSVLAIDEVYFDSSKGLRASADKLKKHFKTEDHAKAALEVLKRGELQLTQEQRMRLTEEKRRQVVTIISKNYVDPRTSLPHPPVRIEQAMQEATGLHRPVQGRQRADQGGPGEAQADNTAKVREGQAYGEDAGAVRRSVARSPEGVRRDT